MLPEIGKERPGLIATVTATHGGRTVALRMPGGPNLIDPGARDWAAEPPDEAGPAAEWRQDFGQVVWLGPQSRFWADQSVFPDRAFTERGWPPDPVCTNARYAVLEQTPGLLRLRGPESRVWQVELTKTWEAQADGGVRFVAEARNVSNKPIQKGLWFNLRAVPSARVLVPVASGADVRVEGSADLRPVVTEGWLHLHAPALSGDESSADAKAYVRPSRGLIRTEAAGGWLELEFKATDQAQVAEGHAPVEIYRKTNRGSWSILEVEQHAPCVALAPGETMSHEEIWRWVPRRDGACGAGRWSRGWVLQGASQARD